MRIPRPFDRIVLVGITLAASGCRPDASARSPAEGTTSAGGTTPRATADTSATAGARPTATGPSEIRSDGIGAIEIGAPVPAEVVAVDAYALRLYADAQPLEGFWIGDPPVFAALASGPYRRWLKESGELDVPPPERFAADAVRDARAGAAVEMVYVEAPGITTREGVGVGTRYDDFMGAYPDADVGRIPPLFEEPTCMGQTGALPRVHFFFDRCEDGGPPPPDALVVRIAVR